MTAKLLPPAIQFPIIFPSVWASTKFSLNFNSDPRSFRGVALRGELTPRLSFLLNEASTFGNLIVNNLDFQSEMNLVRIARKPPEQRLSLSFQLLQVFFGHGPFG
jgi:hypothetical protein